MNIYFRDVLDKEFPRHVRWNFIFIFGVGININSETHSMRHTSEACSMTKINWRNYKVLRSYWGIFFSFFWLKLHTNLPCAAMFSCFKWIWNFTVLNVLYTRYPVLFSVCFYVYTYILAFCCMPYPFQWNYLLGSLFCLFSLYICIILSLFVMISLHLILLYLPVPPPCIPIWK